MPHADGEDKGNAASPAEWNGQLAQYRDRLRQMVAFRLDRRLKGRIDPSDVIQETYLEANNRREEFQKQPAANLFLWLRYLAFQKIVTLHRHHLGRAMRSATRERPMEAGTGSGTSVAIAVQIADRNQGPGSAVAQAEEADRLAAALNGMDPVDREVLALRHYEQLSNAEVAEVLGLTVSAASKRYLRALARLRQVLADANFALPSE